MDFVTEKVRNLPPSGIRKFFDIASEMQNVISLSVGEPDFVTPWSAREAAIVSIERGQTHYTSNQGSTELREYIGKYLKERFEIEYSCDEIFVTVGASEGIDLALRAIINNDDEVLVPNPSYVSYCPCITLAGGKPISIPVDPDNGFIITKELIENLITPKTKAIIFPYPNNPTGATMTKEQLKPLVDYLKDKDIVIISDEIYAELTYDSRHVSIASFDEIKDKVIVLNGFSKSFAMTGWRIGYAAANKDILNAMIKIHQYTMLCAPTVCQMAALGALKHNHENGYMDVKEMTDQYNKRRLKLLKAFKKMGLECHEPKGAFYLFPSIKNTGMTSEEFCTKLLYEKKVAVVPGTAFGSEGFFRCSYAASMKNIDKAIERIGEFLKEI